jgi:2-methylisocitrate lyase-like PEP mutase family enzyme/2-polyprenyl-6-methoxyphenol hydroxylase-like FAD-dependent oxidoreductase
MSTMQHTTPVPVSATVVVVGMGPVGMVAALALAQQGVDVVVLEAGSTLAAESRASTFHPPTLEILDELGVADALHERGLIARNFQYRDRYHVVLADLDMAALAADTKYPYRLQSEQNNLTEIIAARLETMANVRLVFDSPVERVELGSEQAHVFVPGDGRTASYSAEWVIACDGAHSNVRKSLGISFEGMTFPERFLVASTTHELSEDIPGLALVSYVSDPDDWGVLLRTPKHWRVLMQVAPETSDEEATAPEVVETRLQKMSPRAERYPLSHTTIYGVHQRVAARFAAGRVLLAGDAAHVNNPMGGLGMNSGIHDARAAVDAVLATLAGADADAAARAYDDARRDAAISYVQTATKRNYAELQESDAQARHARTIRLADTAADPVKARAYLRGSSMLDSYAVSRARLAAGLRAAAPEVVAPAGRRLAALIAGETLAAPGAYDAVSARALTDCGFRVGYVSGAGVSATVLGAPDHGYVGREDMVDQIHRLVAATEVPLVVDGDGGYGDAAQVAGTVRAYERAGAAAIQLEDQMLPKREGHEPGKRLIAREAMVQKVRSAVEARIEMLVIARTDALQVEGFDAALERVVAYARAGADLVFVEGDLSPAQLERVHRATGRRLVVSRSEAAPAPTGRAASLEEMRSHGVALVIYPVAGLLAATRAVRDTYADIAASGSADPSLHDTWGELTGLLASGPAGLSAPQPEGAAEPAFPASSPALVPLNTTGEPA